MEPGLLHNKLIHNDHNYVRISYILLCLMIIIIHVTFNYVVIMMTLMEFQLIAALLLSCGGFGV